MINLSNTVNNFSNDLTLLKITTKNVKGRPVEIEEEITIKGMVKPLHQEKLAIDKINYSLEYIHYVGNYNINIDDYLLFNDKKYKCFAKYDYSDFGFFKADLEEVK